MKLSDRLDALGRQYNPSILAIRECASEARRLEAQLESLARAAVLSREAVVKFDDQITVGEIMETVEALDAALLKGTP